MPDLRFGQRLISGMVPALVRSFKCVSVPECETQVHRDRQSREPLARVTVGCEDVTAGCSLGGPDGGRPFANRTRARHSTYTPRRNRPAAGEVPHAGPPLLLGGNDRGVGSRAHAVPPRHSLRKALSRSGPPADPVGAPWCRTFDWALCGRVFLRGVNSGRPFSIPLRSISEDIAKTHVQRCQLVRPPCNQQSASSTAHPAHLRSHLSSNPTNSSRTPPKTSSSSSSPYRN